MSEKFHAFEMAQAQFDRVADLLGLEPGVRELLRLPSSVVDLRDHIMQKPPTVGGSFRYARATAK